jgi:hypothetical protein
VNYTRDKFSIENTHHISLSFFFSFIFFLKLQINFLPCQSQTTVNSEKFVLFSVGRIALLLWLLLFNLIGEVRVKYPLSGVGKQRVAPCQHQQSLVSIGAFLVVLPKPSFLLVLTHVVRHLTESSTVSCLPRKYSRKHLNFRYSPQILFNCLLKSCNFNLVMMSFNHLLTFRSPFSFFENNESVGSGCWWHWLQFLSFLFSLWYFLQYSFQDLFPVPTIRVHCQFFFFWIVSTNPLSTDFLALFNSNNSSSNRLHNTRRSMWLNNKKRECHCER